MYGIRLTGPTVSVRTLSSLRIAGGKSYSEILCVGQKKVKDEVDSVYVSEACRCLVP